MVSHTLERGLEVNLCCLANSLVFQGFAGVADIKGVLGTGDFWRFLYLEGRAGWTTGHEMTITGVYPVA